MQYQSPSIQAYLGYEPAELRGTNAMELMHPDDIPKVTLAIAEAIQNPNVVVEIRYRVLHKNGMWRVMESRGKYVPDNDAINGIVINSHDITERTTLEEQLRQAQKMESIGVLAGGIAHDFNNILGIILGYSSILEYKKEDPTAFANYQKAIKTAAMRGAGLVQQLLAFARKTEVKFELFEVCELVRDLKEVMDETFPKIIECSVSCPEHEFVVYADKTQLHQSLLNLCVNARDAMPGGGKLTISITTTPFTELRNRFPNVQQAEYVCLAVHDSGSGMDEATRNKIFEPFFTTKEVGKGTGLGLSVVYGIVKNHKGMIDVVSEIGRGTSFYIYIPSAKHKGEIIIPEVLESKTRGGTETIFVIEDEELLLKIVVKYLEANGYNVLTASDGEEALEQYIEHKEQIHLVLSDIGLPKIGGQVVCEKILAINSNAKIIIASGYLEPNSKSELFKKGVKDFIQKPYDPKEILSKVRRTLDDTM